MNRRPAAMTVIELRTHLEHLPDDMPVWIAYESTGEPVRSLRFGADELTITPYDEPTDPTKDWT